MGNPIFGAASWLKEVAIDRPARQLQEQQLWYEERPETIQRLWDKVRFLCYELHHAKHPQATFLEVNDGKFGHAFNFSHNLRTQDEGSIPIFLSFLTDLSTMQGSTMVIEIKDERFL